MHPTPPRDTQDIVIAAAYWLMHRYQHTRCLRLARLIEQHLSWVKAHTANPTLAQAYPRLMLRWRTVSCCASHQVGLH